MILPFLNLSWCSRIPIPSTSNSTAHSRSGMYKSIVPLLQNILPTSNDTSIPHLYIALYISNCHTCSRSFFPSLERPRLLTKTLEFTSDNAFFIKLCKVSGDFGNVDDNNFDDDVDEDVDKEEEDVEEEDVKEEEKEEDVDVDEDDFINNSYY